MVARCILWLSLAISVLLAVSAEAGADTTIALERAPSKISAELNRVVWSSYDPATAEYYLMSRDPEGTVAQVPIAPRKVPFDVDLGYLGEGIEVATYSRCRKEPSITGGGSGGLLPNWASGRGCDIYLFDFSERRREIRYGPTAGGHASEFLPTASPSGRIAFARVYERRRGRRGKVAYLYAKRGSHSLRRLPGGPRGLSGLPGPTSLDLSGSRLALAWDWNPRNRGIRGSTVRLDEVGGAHRTLESIIGGLIGRSLFTPSLIGGEVLWGRSIVLESGDGSSDFRYRRASSRGSVLGTPAPFSLISTAGTPMRGGIYYIASRNVAGSGLPNRPPACASVPGDGFPSSCTVAQTGPLMFTRER
jgi:hypothetical protein